MSTPGTLYVVATPIGNLDDITQRAMKILASVDLIAAEDTRHSRRLLTHIGINKTSIISLHEHNEQKRVDDLLTQLQKGVNIALISDAGTPLISDPGFLLIQQAHAQNIRVVPIPGPCALITALSAAGLPTNQFIFEGFLPAKASQRRQHLALLREETRTLIFYEAPHRICELLLDLETVFGAERHVVLGRELTKTFESIHGDRLGDLIPWLQADPQRQKGEFVVLVRGATPSTQQTLTPDTLRILEILLRELPTKQAVKLAAQITGKSRNQLYQWTVDSVNSNSLN